MKDPVHYELLTDHYGRARQHSRELGKLLADAKDAQASMFNTGEAYKLAKEALEREKEIATENNDDLSLSQIERLCLSLGNAARDFNAAVARSAELTRQVDAAQKALASVQSLIRDWYQEDDQK